MSATKHLFDVSVPVHGVNYYTINRIVARLNDSGFTQTLINFTKALKEYYVSDEDVAFTLNLRVVDSFLAVSELDVSSTTNNVKMMLNQLPYCTQQFEAIKL